MQRLFGLLALAAAALGLWVLVAGPGVDPISGGKRALSEEPRTYTAWALGLLTGLLLAWLAATDWTRVPSWLSLQRRRIGLIVLGGLMTGLLLLLSG
jgi:hypothetical protein